MAYNVMIDGRCARTCEYRATAWRTAAKVAAAFRAARIGWTVVAVEAASTSKTAADADVRYAEARRVLRGVPTEMKLVYFDKLAHGRRIKLFLWATTRDEKSLARRTRAALAKLADHVSDGDRGGKGYTFDGATASK